MPNTILKRWNGSAFEELYPKTTVTQISASGTPSSTTFLRGDGQWSTAGNLNAQGAITNTPTTVGSGDAIMVAAATGAALQRTTVQFGNGTTTFLRNDGAWGSVTASVALATASVIGGMEIGFTSTETNRAITLSGNKGLVALPRQIPAVTLNNASNTAPSFYAPTTGQTSDYLLAGNGTTLAPVWRFVKTVWETANEQLTAATNVLTIAIPEAGTYTVYSSGAFMSASTTIGVQIKFTFSGTINAESDVFNITGSQNAAASSGDLHNKVAMNEALITTSVSATATDHGFTALGTFTATSTGNFALNFAPETGTTQITVSEGTFLTVERVI